MKKILIAAGAIVIVLGTMDFFKANNGSLPSVILPDSKADIKKAARD